MSYSIRTEQFEGPLEVLLRLIEERKLSVNEIALSEVTEGYFQYLKDLESQADDKNTYSQIAAFLVVAATLILIKSRSLLPGFQLSPEEQHEVQDLTQRLAFYQRMKEIADYLSGLLLNTNNLYEREPFAGHITAFHPPSNFALAELPEIMRQVLLLVPVREALPEKRIEEVISIEERIHDLEVRIQKGAVNSFSDFVGSKEDRTNIIVSFLAMLELVKTGIITVDQQIQFADIRINASKNE